MPRSKELTDQEKADLGNAIAKKLKAGKFQTHRAAAEFLSTVWDKRLDESHYRKLLDYATKHLPRPKEDRRPVVLGLDLATQTGFSLWNYKTEGLIGSGSFSLGKGDYPSEKFNELYMRLHFWRAVYRLQAVAYEDVYSVGLLRSVANAKTLLGLHAVAELFCQQYSIQAVPVHPLTARKHGLAFAEMEGPLKKGKEGKQQGKDAANLSFGIDVIDDNEADALWIGHYALSHKEEG